MVRWLRKCVRVVVPGERAQSTIEYALVVSVTVALLLSISTIVLDGLARYYQEITSVVCLPIP